MSDNTRIRGARLRRFAGALPRPKSGMIGITLTVAAFMAIFQNTVFWKAVIAAADIGMARNLSFGLSLAVAMLAFFVMLLSLFGVRYVFKPAVVVLLMIASVASYFMTVYGVVIDDTMIHNVLETDTGEASGLLNMRLVLHVLFTGVLPAVVVCFWRIRYRSFWKETGIRLVTFVVATVMLGIGVYAHYKDFSLVLRQHRELRYLINPTYPLYAAIEVFSRTTDAANAPIEPLGEDARQHNPGSRERRIVVFVVGETARAANFSLNGYHRDTNPRLEKREIVNFSQFRSCGTSTSVSVPCMFSRLDRDDYDEYEARHSEGLLDVLSHAGVSVLWRDNNSGCKGACARVPTQDLSHAEDADLCNDEECFDEILLRGLEERIADTRGDFFIVLHQKGSHGPEYYKRYPAPFARFKPICASNLPQDCSRQSITNAYDNTILYTDYFLDRLIGVLQEVTSESDASTALFYVSDHGESLGESGIYLHGFPYAFAPEHQTHVPAIAWFSDGFDIDRSCMRDESKAGHSQDGVFDSMLGLFDVKTRVYAKEADIFNSCRTNTVSDSQDS